MMNRIPCNRMIRPKKLIEDPDIPLVPNHNGDYRHYGYNDMEGGFRRKIGKTNSRMRKYENVGARLAHRKDLFMRRRLFNDICLFLAIFGIVVMILETEFVLNDVYTRDMAASLVVKGIITVSTIFLLMFLLWYHYLDMKIYMIDNGIDDWRLCMTLGRVAKVTLEVFVCFIHPLPVNTNVYWSSTDLLKKNIKMVAVPIDLVFSLPMFLRLYLIGRTLLLHSKLFADASCRSLGALNRISFNFNFIFKSYMDMYPTTVLSVIMVIGLTTAAWMMRACEMYHDKVYGNFFNSIWLILITALTVGYGDIVPMSYCGRGIAVLTGIFGAGCTALVVAVLASKLEMSRAEKYVHSFVIDIELDKAMKHAAANVVREGWTVYRMKKHGSTSARVRYHQRRLISAIKHIRKIKNAKRMEDSSITLIEMSKCQNEIYESVSHVKEHLGNMKDRIDNLESKLDSIDTKLGQLYSLIET